MPRFPTGVVFVVLAAIGLSAALAWPAPPAGRFEDVTAESGLAGDGRAAWADFDADGHPDAIIGGKLWRNDAGKFADITVAAGLAGNPGDTAIWADFDNDGRLDVYFGGGAGALYLGRSDGTFAPGEAEPNPHQRAQGVAAADIDHDGWVDVYLANYEDWKDDNTWPYPDIILRNDRGKLRRWWEADAEHRLPGRGVAFGDVDGDGRVEAYVSNYRLAPNFLWRFPPGAPPVDIAAKTGCAGVDKPEAQVKNGHGLEYTCRGHTIGSLFADFDDDGRFDLFVGNFSHPPRYQDRPQMLRNTAGPEGGVVFEDQSVWAALPWQESYAHPAAADYDNDGWVDLYFTTVYERDGGRLFRNRRDFVFSDVTVPTGTATERSYQAAWADYDGDGRVDLLAGGRLFANRTDLAGHWLALELKGGPCCNRAAIGARAFIRQGSQTISRQVTAGSGSSNQDDLVLHFGLGPQTGPRTVEIIWPCGRTQKLEAEPDRKLRVVETAARWR